MGIAAGRAHLAHLVIERLPVAGQDMPARNDDVDFRRAGCHAFADFGQPQMKRGQSRRKARGHGRHGYPASGKRVDGGWHHLVIDADRAHGDVGHAQRLEQIGADRLARLGAEPRDPAFGIVARQRGQVDTGDRLEQPGRLMILLDGPPRAKAGGAPFDGGPVGLRRTHPVHIQLHAGIARL